MDSSSLLPAAGANFNAMGAGLSSRKLMCQGGIHVTQVQLDRERLNIYEHCSAKRWFLKRTTGRRSNLSYTQWSHLLACLLAYLSPADCLL
mmetsp:Transcript_31190/g.52644  ORF Transcript_31190/g.52644 Transcript_31190/m.52644 type:complete len:91 (-) Transcript_31190:601-873(-)